MILPLILLLLLIIIIIRIKMIIILMIMMTILVILNNTVRTWMMQNKLAWKGKSVNDFISSYIGDQAEEIQEMLEATARLSDELGQKADGRYLEAASQHAALVAAARDVDERYRASYREVEQAFMGYASLLVEAVRGAPRPQSGGVQEWAQAAHVAAQVDQERARIWDEWRREVACWDDVPEVALFRPDLQGFVDDLERCEEASQALRVERDGVLMIYQQAPAGGRQAAVYQQAEEDLWHLQQNWQEALDTYLRDLEAYQRSTSNSALRSSSARSPSARSPLIVNKPIMITLMILITIIVILPVTKPTVTGTTIIGEVSLGVGARLRPRQVPRSHAAPRRGAQLGGVLGGQRQLQ